MKNLTPAYAIIIGSLILGLFLYFGLSVNRYSHIEGNKIIDQKTGTLYDLDKKQYIKKNGDLYQYEQSITLNKESHKRETFPQNLFLSKAIFVKNQGYTCKALACSIFQKLFFLFLFLFPPLPLPKEEIYSCNNIVEAQVQGIPIQNGVCMVALKSIV